MVAVTIEQTDPAGPPAPGAGDAFVESLMDTDLYSMGAFFCDQHPELVDDERFRGGRTGCRRDGDHDPVTERPSGFSLPP